jgi:signal transduction histidine kinase
VESSARGLRPLSGKADDLAGSLVAVHTIVGRHQTLRCAQPGELGCGLLDVVDSVGTAIVAVAVDGTVLFANARAMDVFSRREGAERFDPDARRWDVAEVLAPIDELIATQRSHGRRRPTLRVGPEGSERIYGYTISATRDEASGPYVIAFQDVTELLQLEDERDRLLKLATVGEVMPMLLHETKNPLSAALTTLELLLEERSEPALQADLHGVLVEIRRALLSLEGLGSVGRSLRAPRAHAIDHAIREVVSLLEARAKRHGVHLVCEVPALPLLALDPSSMRGIVLNLVTNAVQACKRPESHVLVRLGLEGATLRLDVIDGGSGMPPEVLARCRELFFTTKRHGSGIGLALCVRLVEEAGGTVDIRSEPGHGTHVAIMLPDVGSKPAHA